MFGKRMLSEYPPPEPKQYAPPANDPRWGQFPGFNGGHSKDWGGYKPLLGRRVTNPNYRFSRDPPPSRPYRRETHESDRARSEDWKRKFRSRGPYTRYKQHTYQSPNPSGPRPSAANGSGSQQQNAQGGGSAPAQAPPLPVNVVSCMECGTSLKSPALSFLFYALCTGCHTATQDPPLVQYNRWFDALEPAFTIEAGKTLTEGNFPDLPLGLCKCVQAKCETTTDTTPSGIRRRICKHNVKELLQASGSYNKDFLKKWRIRFHPDFFNNRCVDARKDQGVRRANSMFLIIHRLYEKEVLSAG